MLNNYAIHLEITKQWERKRNGFSPIAFRSFHHKVPSGKFQLASLFEPYLARLDILPVERKISYHLRHAKFQSNTWINLCKIT